MMTAVGLLLTDRVKVREKCGKTSSDIDEYISTLKEWFHTQKHLPEIPDDNMIEYFLHNCKFSIEKTKRNMDMYYTARTLMPEFFVKTHPLKYNNKELVEKMGSYVVLPNLTEELYRISVLKYGKDAELYDPYKLAGYEINYLEIRCHEDLVMGEVIIVDAEFLSLTHVIKLNPVVFKKFMILLEKLWSNRLKGIHILNYPTIIEKLMSMAKMFFKEKIFNRIHLHQDYESLYKYIPRNNLPSDYGGNEKSTQELKDLWQVKFKEYEKRFDVLEDMKVNENLRPESLSNSDTLGYYGNFRKIDVD